MKDKGSILIVFGIIFGAAILTLLVGGGYYLGKKNQYAEPPQNKPSRVIDITAKDSPIFVNNELGVSIKYPSSWISFKPSDLGIGGAIAAFGSSKNAYGSWARPIPANESFVTVGSTGGRTLSEIAESASRQGKVINELNKSGEIKGQINYKIISQEWLTISGYKVVKIITSIDKEGPFEANGISEGYFVTYTFEFENKNKNTDSYHITLWTALPLTETTKKHIMLFEEMVKTFSYKVGNN